MIYARRYYWADIHPFDNTKLLDAFVAHPEFLAYPQSPAEARVIGAALLTDPNNIIWAAYSDKELTGVVILTRIIPRVDALLHFMFLDKDLVSKRRLLNNIIGVCFTDFGLNRLSMEVPDRVAVLKGRGKIALGTKLERFARRALGFRLEGEIRNRNPELPKAISDDWVARQGSRREQAYFDGADWFDIVLLRLLASEWVGTGEGEANECRSEPQHQSSPPLPEPPLAA